VLVVACLIVLTAALVIWRISSRHEFFSSAVMLVSKEHWVGPVLRNAWIQNYDWLTDTEVMLYRKNADKTVSLLRRQVVPNGESTDAVEIPLPKLQNACNITISMDRQSLCVLYMRPRIIGKAGTTSELISIKDGKRSGPVPNWITGLYYPGEKAECTCLYSGEELMVSLSTFDSRKPRVIPITGLKNTALQYGTVSPLFIEPSGRVVATSDTYYTSVIPPAEETNLSSKISPVRSFVEFNLNHPELPGKSWTVPVPSDAATFNCVVSPQHDRLLWIVQSKYLPAFTQLSQRFPKPIRQHPVYMDRWMVSDLAGNHMHTIAEFEDERTDHHFYRPDPIYPKWMPDGKHVSYEYKDALYMTSAQ